MKMKKTTRIPVASHGLHLHKYNYPLIGTYDFMDCYPVYINHLRKGESDHVNGVVFSRTNPLTNPAFITGRYVFKAFFCPYKYIFTPWYYFDNGTEYKKADGTMPFYTSAPYTTIGKLCTQFVASPDTNTSFVNTGSSSNYDFRDSSGSYWLFTDLGKRTFKMLCSLGYQLNWKLSSTDKVNILAILCYLKIYAEYYFPNQYVGNTAYKGILDAIKVETNDYSSNANTVKLLYTLGGCSYAFFEDSLFYQCFDNPVGCNAGVGFSPNNYNIVDNTASSGGAVVKDDANNGTPEIDITGVKVLTKYINNVLDNITNFVKRRQLAGGRLLSRFMVDRGVSLNNDSVQKPYYLGKSVVELNVDAVENNSDTNLGELAGKGTASTSDKPLEFNCSAQDDGVFMVVACVLPDAEIPNSIDGFNFLVEQMDFYHPEFDKQGVTPVNQSCLAVTNDGTKNFMGTFGFLNRYWEYLQDKPRLVGDFLIPTLGASTLESFYGFRIFGPNRIPALGLSHAYDLLAGSQDTQQFKRFFYSSVGDNLQCYIRWFGQSYREKLPLGDSFDWDDDEFNRKVSVVTVGSQIS